jgi:hypothetical protein
VSEPSNLWVAGTDALFSREFFTSARSSLEPGGVYMQWLQLYEANCEMVFIILNTLHSVFGEIRAFHGSQGDLLLLASPAPIRLTAESIDGKLAAHPEVAASLAEIGITSVQDLLGREVASLPQILERASAYPVHTLDGARLLHLAGRGMFEGVTVQVPELAGLDAGGRCGPR